MSTRALERPAPASSYLRRVVGGTAGVVLVAGWLTLVSRGGLLQNRLPALPALGAPNYASQPTGHLRPVSRRFVTDVLGRDAPAAFAPAIVQATVPPGAPSDSGPVRAATPTPVVSETPGCVDGHQTADPLSPPCAQFFKGDNGGATYPGVTADEVNVLVYADQSYDYLGGGLSMPSSGYFDLSAPADPAEYFTVTAWRAWSQYFNRHYQTYGRHVHMYLYNALPGGTDLSIDAQRRDDATKNYFDVRPFAVLYDATSQGEDSYLRTMASFGAVTFTASTGQAAPGIDKLAPYVWSYYPTIEQQADLYASYVCQKVVPFPVAMSGNVGANGRPRRLALLHTANPTLAGDVERARLVGQKVRACGGDIVAEATYPSGSNACLFLDFSPLDPRFGTPNPSGVTYGIPELLDFERKGVTTVLWPGCLDQDYGVTANALGYTPEWVVFGDGTFDGRSAPFDAGLTAAFDHHAVVVSSIALYPDPSAQYCNRALGEEGRALTYQQVRVVCPDYAYVRLVFTAIQQAGPRLTPTGVEHGLRALPLGGSGDPQLPVCAFAGTGHTCVKDAQVEYWDATQFPLGFHYPGCWRSIVGGRRYTAGHWPAGNINAQITGTEPCNNYDPIVFFQY